jgi:hypothetical protein
MIKCEIDNIDRTGPGLRYTCAPDADINAHGNAGSSELAVNDGNN